MMKIPNRELDRRSFALGAAALGASLAAPPVGSASAAPSEVPSAIRSLYERAIVIDALASPNTFNVPYPPIGPLTQAQLDNVRASGMTAINLTVNEPAGFGATVREIGFWLDQIRRHPDYFLLVQKRSDIEAAKAQRKLGLIFGFQDMSVIGDDLSLIDTFSNLSVKIMQLTYNARNLLGAGSSLPETEGLTELGRGAVARLNALGIVVDTAHANSRTVLDAAQASKAPIIISHTGARAIFDSQRNQPDDVLRTVTQKGGVVGVYLMPYLGHDPVAASRALYMRHLRHVIDVCGEDHVCVGSDQSLTPIDINAGYMNAVRQIAEARQRAGIGAPGEADSPITVPDLNDARRIEIIAAELYRAGYPTRVIEKIAGANFHRVFNDVWSSAE